MPRSRRRCAVAPWGICWCPVSIAGECGRRWAEPKPIAAANLYLTDARRECHCSEAHGERLWGPVASQDWWRATGSPRNSRRRPGWFSSTASSAARRCGRGRASARGGRSRRRRSSLPSPSAADIVLTGTRAFCAELWQRSQASEYSAHFGAQGRNRTTDAVISVTGPHQGEGTSS
jgi:hypothetical protein